MATARFGLTLGDVLSTHDKQVIDTVLAALETHDHKGGSRVLDPTAAPTGVLSLVDGRLAAGVTYYYRHSYVDRYGLETAASAEVAFTTPGPISAPAQPTVSTLGGGTLGPGTSYYALSAVDAAGDETALSNPSIITITTQFTVRVSGRTFQPGVTAYNVWRQGPRSTGFTKIGQITDATQPFLDTGAVADDPCACDPTNLPPAINLTNATSNVTLTVADPLIVGADPSKVKSWRIYRATQSGVYGPNSLLNEVTETLNSDGTGGLVTTYVDDGTLAPGAGRPQEVSQTLIPSVKIVGGGGGGAVLFSTSGVTSYRLVTSADGSLVTRVSPGGRPDPSFGDIYLISDPGGTSYKLVIDDYGTLTTTAAVAGAGDSVYLAGQGPLLPSPDPTISYQLGVADDGSLTTVEV